MSDARAKAEARRAKILAREMKVSALGTDDISLPLPSVSKKIIVDINNSGDTCTVEGDTTIDPSTTDNSISPAITSSISIKERPIAARRHLIKSASLTTVSDSANSAGDSIDNTAITTDSTENVAAIVNHDDPEVESIEQFEKKDAAAPSSSSKVSSSKESTSKLVIAKKTLKEIESEVAQNTAAFDAKTLSKGTTNEKKDANATTTDDASALKKSQQLKLNKLPSNIQPSSVMRLVRLVIIILLGLYQGYVVIRANNQVSKSSSSSSVIIDSTEILQQSQPTISSSRKGTTSTRTWSQWFVSTLTSPFESSITAVGVAWWIASIMENTVAIRFKEVVPPSKGIFERLLALYNNGFEGILERIFCTIGEYSLHAGTILLVAALFTLYSDIPDVASLNAHYSGVVIDSSSTVSSSVVASVLEEL